jgi:pyruvate,water dikinase
VTVELTWEAPDDGVWWLLPEHFPTAVSRLFSSIFPMATLGWVTAADHYGLSTQASTWASVNGWIYYGPSQTVASETLAERATAAERTLRTTPWRDEVRRWHDDERPRAIASNRAIQSVDLEALDDAALADHFGGAVHNFLTLAPLHFEHRGFDIAAGHLVVAARTWGLNPVAVVDLLTGASPATSAPDRHFDRIAAALDGAAAPPPASLAEIRAVGPAAVAALDGYLDEYGWRPLMGHDVREPTYGERPQLVLAALNARRAALSPPADRGTDLASDVAAVRAQVPADERDRFDVLLADARQSYGLRDDDVGVCWNWPIGLVRRAALEIGRRAASAGNLVDRDDIFEAEPDEVVAVLAGNGPSAAELAARSELWVVAAAAVPPPQLGETDPSASSTAAAAVPASVAAVDEIQGAVWAILPRAPRAPLHGLGVGSEVVSGPACVVRRTEELTRLAAGDVLVAITTTTSFNGVFPLLAGVITEEGGVFSHTAILARELGLPAVIGVPGLLNLVHDGDVVTIDPVAGEVRVSDQP